MKDEVFVYKTRFCLLAPVRDITAARDYLTSDDMEEYLKSHILYDKNTKFDREDLVDNIASIEWCLQTEESGAIVLRTYRLLTDDECNYISEWIRGQNSDGLGEGFEQQSFAEWWDDEEEEYEGCDPFIASFDWETNDYELHLLY